jgi:hypothetical protein
MARVECVCEALECAEGGGHPFGCSHAFSSLQTTPAHNHDRQQRNHQQQGVGYRCARGAARRPNNIVAWGQGGGSGEIATTPAPSLCTGWQLWHTRGLQQRNKTAYSFRARLPCFTFPRQPTHLRGPRHLGLRVERLDCTHVAVERAVICLHGSYLA